MTGSLLGVSVLELRTDQTHLDAGLALARRKVDVSGHAMQTSWDRRMVSMGSSMKTAAMSSTGSLTAMTGAGGRLRQTVEANAIAERTYQQEITKGSAARRRAAAETRTLATQTGVSARAMRDLYGTMGPVGRGLGDLTTRTRLYRDHGVDYLAAGLLGLGAGFVALSAKAAVHFVDLTETVQRETGLSGRALDGLMSVIRSTARDSPYQIGQVADAAVILRREFHQSDAQISHTANLMVAFSKAAGQDVRPEMQQLSRVMHDYRVPLGSVVDLTDKLVSLSQATQQPLSATVNVLDRFGPRLQALGLNLNDSLRLLGMFSAAGIRPEQMGRGLTAAMTQMSAVQTTGTTKLEGYRLAVQSAQLRVDSLRKSLALGNVDQQKYDQELVIAQGHLQLAKQKYAALDQTLKDAKLGHAGVSDAIQGEIRQIVLAQSKQDALNLAVQFFGKSLGPAMATAFWHNQKALDAVDKALKRTHTTQRLFQVDAKSLPGELQRAKNNFQDLEIAVGTRLVPALSHGVDWLRRTAGSIDDFYKRHQKLVLIGGEILGISSALTLLSRHTPLGGVLGKILADSGHTTLAKVFSGKTGTGIWGAHGPNAAGSDANPINVRVTNPSGGGGGGGAGKTAATATEDAVAAEASRAARLGLKVGGTAVAGVSAFAAASHAQGGALNQLNAMAHGVDPTNVLHLVGLPSLSDLLPRVKQRMPLTPTDIAMLGSGWTPQQVQQYEHLRGLPASATRQPRFQSFGAIGVRPAGVSQVQKDYLGSLGELAKLRVGKQGAEQTARALANLGMQAKRVGDVRWHFADTLGVELLRSRDVASRDTLGLIHQLDKLPPAARRDASQGMVQMAQMLESQGRLPLGSTVHLVTEMLAQYRQARDKGGQYFASLQLNAAQTMETLRKKVVTSTGKTRLQALAELHLLQAGEADVFSKMETDVSNKQAAMTRAIANGSATAASEAGTNLNQYASNVANAMHNGLLKTNVGSQLIAKALNATLKAFGAHGIPMPSAIQWANWAAGNASAGSYSNSGSGIGHRSASGGLFQIGQPGEPGRDTVPLNVGGTPIIVAPGEQVAVFNRHQLPIVNARLSDLGGLPGLFQKVNKPNYMAEGGVVPQGYASGGYSGYSLPLPKSEMLPGSWSIDQGVDIPAPANTPEFAIGPGRIVGEGISGFGPNAPILKLTAGPLAGREIYYGHAGADTVSTGARVSAGDQISEVGAGIVGKSTGPHIEIGFYPPGAMGAGSQMAQLLHALMSGAGVSGIPGGSAGGAGAGSWKDMTAPRVGGIGTIADIVRAALRKMTGAANRYGRAHAGGSAGSVAGLSGSVVQMVKQLSARYGWDQAQVNDWLKVINAESGGNPTARNPSSGAYGIGQFLGATLSEYAKYGATSPNAANQLFAMGKYIHDRYGTPSAAWAHELANHWYDRGGIVHAARGIHTGHHTGIVRGHTSVRKPHVAKSAGKTLSASALRELALIGGKVKHIEADISDKSSQFSAMQSRFSTVEQSRMYTNSDGSTNSAGLAKQVEDNKVLLGLAEKIEADYQAELPLVTHVLSKYLGKQSRIEKAIRADQKKLTANKERGASIRTALLALEKPSSSRVTMLQDEIAKVTGQYGGRVRAAQNALKKYRGGDPFVKQRLRNAVLDAQTAEQNALAPLKSTLLAAKGSQQHQSLVLKDKKYGLHQELNKLTNEDAALARKISSLKGVLSGAAGTGSTNSAITLLESVAQNLGTVEWSGSKFKGIDTRNQGAAYDEETTVLSLKNAIGDLQGQAANTDTSQLLALEQQIAQTTSQELAVSQAQYATLRDLGELPPFGGSFGGGGTVPGAIGAARTVIAHGGETITPPGHDKKASFTLVVQDGAVNPDYIKVIANGEAVKVTRQVARHAGRRLPSRGGR